MRNLYLFFILSAFYVLALGSTNSTSNNLKDTNPVFLNESYYAGFIPIQKKGSLFYWLFESRKSPKEDPLVIWLSGGSPGCSSEVAIFVENGPYRINKATNTLEINPYSWNNIANVLYIDQPLGTGYSTTNQLNKNSDEVASDFYLFLQQFLKSFPQYKGRNVYITGSAYAGHFIPPIVLKIQSKGDLDIKLKGIAIGNGLVSMLSQTNQIAQFAYDNKVVDYSTFAETNVGLLNCVNYFNYGWNSIAAHSYQTHTTKLIGNPPKFNLYDLRLTCVKPPHCYDFSFIDNFLGQESVQEALGVVGKKWIQCNDHLKSELFWDGMTDHSKTLSLVVQSGIRVLLYNGDKDLLGNWIGGHTLANCLVWAGQSHFWQIPLFNDQYGYSKFLGNLMYASVFNSGLLVGMDQPKASLNMLMKLMNSWDTI